MNDQLKAFVALRKDLRDAKLAYHEKHDAMTSAEAALESARIVTLTAAHAAAITVGALPCPFCEQTPHGIEHQASRGYEYQVGCLSCPPFQHTDGTTRQVSARGGVLPQHTVDLWNAGPDFWSIPRPVGEFKAAVIGKAEPEGDQ